MTVNILPPVSSTFTLPNSVMPGSVLTVSNSAMSGSVLTVTANGSASWIAYPSTSPLVTLIKSRPSGAHSLEKIEDKKWKVIHLTFDELIELQERDIKFAWIRKDDDIFICFETDGDEAQAIMIVGRPPYDE